MRRPHPIVGTSLGSQDGTEDSSHWLELDVQTQAGPSWAILFFFPLTHRGFPLASATSIWLLSDSHPPPLHTLKEFPCSTRLCSSLRRAALVRRARRLRSARDMHHWPEKHAKALVVPHIMVRKSENKKT